MRRVVALLVVVAAASCAPPPVVVPMPTVLAHPEFVYPAAPPGTPAETVERLDRGWRLLQSNDAAAAAREFDLLNRAATSFAPALAGQGYAALARGRHDEAVAAFDRATAATPYAPALVGRGLAQLAAGRDDDALASFAAALAADPALPDLAGRIETLRVRQLQDRVTRAERAAAAERWDEARTAYRAAIAASPDSAFLYRDLARVELRAGQGDAALEQARQALALDDDDARAHLVVAEVLDRRDDVAGALAAYERAAAIDPTPAAGAAIARLRERARIAALPPQYHAIAAAPAATRADLAALLGVHLAARLASAPQRQLVVTDVRGHWAQPWIEATARAGAMEVFSNYTFQPATRLRRGDVADVVSRVLALGGAAAARWDLADVAIADVPPGHLAYPAVRRAVASGVMPLDGGAFRLLQPVSGAELTAIVSRLAATGAGQ